MIKAVSIEGLSRAIKVWESVMRAHEKSMKDIKKARPVTWFFSRKYWQHEREFHKLFTGLIRRRIQLQTAIKEKESSR